MEAIPGTICTSHAPPLLLSLICMDRLRLMQGMYVTPQLIWVIILGTRNDDWLLGLSRPIVVRPRRRGLNNDIASSGVTTLQL